MSQINLTYPIRSYLQIDRTGYQQFLREQRLNEHDIKFLNIHFVTDFTLSHFKGCAELAAGGAFFKRGREYVEQENKTTRAFYQPVHPNSKYAAIFLRPAKCHTPAHLNSVFLHETRHHIQHCRNLPCSKPLDYASVDGVMSNERNQPWEIDAEEFADKYSRSNTFLQMVPHRLKRSDLQFL